MFLAGKTMRNELKMFWRLCQETNEAARTGISCDLDDICDELETLSMMTDWPMLKARCASQVALIKALPLAVSA